MGRKSQIWAKGGRRQKMCGTKELGGLLRPLLKDEVNRKIRVNVLRFRKNWKEKAVK